MKSGLFLSRFLFPI
ncbi:hypothetical protein CGSHi3655_08736 [Haemophilus influenzae 3655]|uniref:Uncharacterized protein n=1 Tax=Haemophilus influenzae (strain NTHi 3655) TaxID=375177 RepID=A0A0H3PD12_HAEI3|nr:hypothetical protein CGSHi3655_08736 [Haemophilus influenzae 3655]